MTPNFTGNLESPSPEFPKLCASLSIWGLMLLLIAVL